MSQKEYRHTVRVCKHRARKAKAYVELNLARTKKDNRKGFYKYSKSKRKTGKCGPAAEVGRGFGDKGHGGSQSTQCLLHLYIYWADLPLANPGPCG